MHFFNNSTFFFYKSGCNFCAVTLILQRGGYQRKVMIIILRRYGRIKLCNLGNLLQGIEI